MRSLLILLFSTCFILSCDDGDVLNVQLEFDKELSICDSNTAIYILYDTREDPSESLTLLFPNNAQAQAVFNPVNSGDVEMMTINASTVRFLYRTYAGDPNDYICQDIPDENVSVIQNYEANGGTVIFTSTFEDDDSDPNAIVRTTKVLVTLKDIDLSILATDNFILGTYESTD